jgi:hypothetical protein
VAWQAIQMDRKGLGIELKRSYFELSCRFLAEMELQLAQPQMFTLEELEAA